MSKLERRESCTKLVSKPILDGIEPVKEFTLKYKFVILMRFENECGIDPCRRFAF